MSYAGSSSSMDFSGPDFSGLDFSKAVKTAAAQTITGAAIRIGPLSIQGRAFLARCRG